MTGTHVEASTVAGRLESVRERIALACRRCGRSPGDVTLIGISKTFSATAVAEALDAGLADLGENRVQEGVPKAHELAERGYGPRWHLVGHLQTNKVKQALQVFHTIHSVDSERLLNALAQAAQEPVDIFLEVNVSGEESKYGLPPSDLPRIVDLARAAHHVNLLGLMTIPPESEGTAGARRWFGVLRELAGQHGLEALSMGMTNDFEVAIEEGATHVRVGRAIFGERQ